MEAQLKGVTALAVQALPRRYEITDLTAALSRKVKRDESKRSMLESV